MHFRTEVSDADYEIYKIGLKDINDPYRIDEAFYRCLRECEFMPKLKDIFDRLPDRREARSLKIGKIVREWCEPTSDGFVIHYFETDSGDKFVRLEKRQGG